VTVNCNGNAHCQNDGCPMEHPLLYVPDATHLVFNCSFVGTSHSTYAAERMPDISIGVLPPLTRVTFFRPVRVITANPPQIFELNLHDETPMLHQRIHELKTRWNSMLLKSLNRYRIAKGWKIGSLYCKSGVCRTITNGHDLTMILILCAPLCPPENDQAALVGSYDTRTRQLKSIFELKSEDLPNPVDHRGRLSKNEMATWMNCLYYRL